MDSEYVTAVDASDPTKGNRTVYVLEAYCNEPEYLAGVEELGLLRNLTTRDGDDPERYKFLFLSEDDREAAKAKLVEAGYRLFP